ncbi:MAG: PilZ domain-containing protein [Erythrobacter sp.]
MRTKVALSANQTGRRAAPRLRLSLPGTFLAVRGNLRCIVTNMSQTGVLMVVDETLGVGETGYLRCGPIDHFVTVMRKEYGLNGLEFDRPVSHEFVLEMRAFQESFAERDRADLMRSARAWAQGEFVGRV